MLAAGIIYRGIAVKSVMIHLNAEVPVSLLTCDPYLSFVQDVRCPVVTKPGRWVRLRFRQSLHFAL